jgi:acetyl-CoA carboxylase carboxyl transferase subunit beta
MSAFMKKTKYVKIQNKEGPTPNIPPGSWVKCKECGEVIYKDDFHSNNRICIKCESHFRLDAYSRLKLIVDEGSFEEIGQEITTKNILDFPQYNEKIEALKLKTGLSEGVVTGIGTIGEKKVAIGVMDARFIMASMGAAVGERITRLIEKATEERLPLILFTASGGARMQEGIISLMQMAKTSAALGRHSKKGLLYITVLTDPTSGGVTASFAMLGDIILAEPGCFVGFAGPRVIRDTINQELPVGFQRAEFLLEHGFIDKIVSRNELKQTLIKILELHP